MKKLICIGCATALLFNISYANKISVGDYKQENLNSLVSSEIKTQQNFWLGFAQGFAACSAAAGVFMLGYSLGQEAYINDSNEADAIGNHEENLDFSSFDVK